jgi:hypothetical protein
VLQGTGVVEVGGFWQRHVDIFSKTCRLCVIYAGVEFNTTERLDLLLAKKLIFHNEA